MRGGGELEEAIARQPAGVRIHRVGHVQGGDLPLLYRQAAAFLFPSLAEGFGIPLLEAMASGCPAMTSAIPPLEEIAGGAALLVDPLSVEAMAEAVERLAGDESLRRSLRRRGLERASEFSWERTARETLAVLEEAP